MRLAERLGADHRDEVERPLAVAPEDHRPEHQQVVGLAVAEPDLAAARGDGHDHHREQEPGEHPPLAVVAPAGPAVEQAGEPDGDDQQVEGQVQPQRRGRVGPAVGQVVDRARGGWR